MRNTDTKFLPNNFCVIKPSFQNPGFEAWIFKLWDGCWENSVTRTCSVTTRVTRHVWISPSQSRCRLAVGLKNERGSRSFDVARARFKMWNRSKYYKRLCYRKFLKKERRCTFEKIITIRPIFSTSESKKSTAFLKCISDFVESCHLSNPLN